MCPIAQPDRDDGPWLVDEDVPGKAAMLKNVVIGAEDAVGEPVVADEPRCHRHRDLGQMQVHRRDVAAGQDKGRALAVLGADGAEDIGRGGALIVRRRGSRAAPGPAPGDLVLLADPGLVGKPHLYRGRIDLLVARELVHNRGEALLKSSMAPSAWA